MTLLTRKGNIAPKEVRAMAFQRREFSTFYQLLKDTNRNSHPEECPVAENFILEERLTEQREDNYGEHINSSVNIDNWMLGHKNYISDKINVHSGTPETFTNRNNPNLLNNIEQDQYMVRLEAINWPSSLMGKDINQMVDYLRDFVENTGNPDIIRKFLADWNKERDLRPIFAGFWGEVKDIFTDPTGDEINNDDWANQLRDRFGLGHFDTLDGEPIPVVLMRYRVRDVINAASGETKIIAVPSVLDGDWSPFFCPTPTDGWNEGQSLDLSPGGENQYSLNCEILHRFIEYQQSYLYRTGWINRPPGKTCEEARKIHLELLQHDFKNFEELDNNNESLSN